MILKTKLISSALVAVVLGVGLFFTPHLTIWSMKSAADAKDAVKLSGYVDFPALKESLKSAFSAKMAAEVTRQKESNPFAALGAAVAGAMVSTLVDAFVTPDNLALLMKGEEPQLESGKKPRDRSTGTELETAMSYEGVNRFVLTVKKKSERGEPTGFVFRRDGVISWKLAGIRLPD